jgi:uncharacterized damage-inducible protein DinB
MSAQELIHQFRFNQMTLTRLLADVSHDDSLSEPQPGINSVNWLLGHILATRGRLLEELGQDPEWRERLIKVYNKTRDHFPAGAFAIAELNGLVPISLDQLAAALQAAALGNAAPSFPHLPEGGTLADHVGAFVCHEEYHVGQIGLVRRLIGKPGLF